MSASLQKLQDLLQKLFRADAADLDFGIYRIINYRRDQLQDFIDTELSTIVSDALDANPEPETARQELENLAEEVRQNLEAREQRGSTQQTRDQREDAVFNHLFTFFSRYYESGDFIPRRRYSQTERYAVPYNGEEVYLHWANKDQYYVKSGEHFSTYRFKSQDIGVTFELQEVDIERDNVQGEKRFFMPLAAETTYDNETDEVTIPFEYRPLTDAEKKQYSGQNQQDKIINAAEPKILTCLNDYYTAQSELARPIGDESTLKKHLRTYTRRNTADFFIHKDLKKFLNRELDVYIKNEVLPLTDLIFNNCENIHNSGGGTI